VARAAARARARGRRGPRRAVAHGRALRSSRPCPLGPGPGISAHSCCGPSRTRSPSSAWQHPRSSTFRS
jgi:hypothetical protein